MQSFPVESYQIGIISALPKELKAVIAILDEEHKSLEGQDTRDQNTYVLGAVGKHKVVAACLPAGVYGTNTAASVSKDMLRTFSHLRFGLFVGIGGGIPDIQAGRDIRLGDVVVSQPNQAHGGVVQYDLGKRLADGRFKRGRNLNRPPTALLTALGTLQARSGFDGNWMRNHLDKIDEKHPFLKTDNYYFQGHDQDQLSCTRCDPSQWWWALWMLIVWLWPLWQCQFCDNGRIRRPSRTHDDPAIYYGTIASGNTLLKNALVRDQLKNDLEALCVEMEAAGVVEEFPCLVVRGICDYADVQKNDMWQEYAALTAAAFAKQLLGYISPQMTKLENPIADVLDKFDRHFQRQQVFSMEQRAHQQRQDAFIQQQEIRYQTQRHQNCHLIFKTSDYEGQKNINPRAVPGTCRWVLDHPQYKCWSTSVRDGDLLWISADPGCGKSVLSRMLIDTFQDDHTRADSIAICYFFFKDNEQQNNLNTALCAILHQLFNQQPGLIDHALLSFDKGGEKLQSDTYELWRILLDAASDAKACPIVCVLDALDECHDNDRARLIELLCQSYQGSQTGTSKVGSLKWLATSRPYDDVRDQFENIPSTLPSIRLRGEDENDSIQKEIDLVIQERMKGLSRELNLSPTKAKEVAQQLLSMEHRTYLWLYLAIDAIKDAFRDALRPSDQVIPLVPASIEEAYERILARVSAAQKNHAIHVLTIVVGARRPLTVEEMALALDVATLPEPPVTTADLTIDARQLGDSIRRWCGLFVFVNHGQVFLLHQTAKEFLVHRDDGPIHRQGSWKHCLPLLEVERQLAMICVRFLCLSDLNHSGQKTDIEDNQDEGNGKEALLTFFNFAAENWASYTHTAEESIDEKTKAGVRRLYDEYDLRKTRWFPVMWQKHTYYDYSVDCPLTAVQLAAFNGHHQSLQELLDNTSNKIERQDNELETSLIWASQLGHLQVVRLLLDRGADVNVANGRTPATALTWASQMDHLEVVRLLLDTGADVNATGASWGKTALESASRVGYLGIVRLLLDRGADINAASDLTSKTALISASHYGHPEVVRLLLDRGADVSATGGYPPATALTWASRTDRLEVIQLLLDGGSIPEANTLYQALRRGDLDVIRLLLDRGADVYVDSIDGYSPETALKWASGEGRLDIVRFLLDRGSKPDTKALGAASQGGHLEIVRLLLDRGATPGTDALILSSMDGHLETVRLLLDRGADVNSVDDHIIGTALKWASHGGYIEIVSLLLDRGATSDTDAVSTASRQGYLKIVQLLLDRGVFFCNSALEGAVSHGDFEVVRMLLDNGVNIDVIDDSLKISADIFVLASVIGNLETVQALLDRGADINAFSSQWRNTALAAALTEGHLEVVRILVDRGASVDLRIIFMATQHGHFETAQMLLDRSPSAVRRVIKLIFKQGPFRRHKHCSMNVFISTQPEADRKILISKRRRVKVMKKPSTQ